MTIPKTYEECRRLAHADADRAAARWRKLTVEEREGRPSEEVWRDTYSVQFYLHTMLMEGSVERLAEALIDHCRQIGNGTTLAAVVAAVIRSAEERFGNDAETSLQEMIAGLVAIFGTEAVRAAIDQAR